MSWLPRRRWQVQRFRPALTAPMAFPGMGETVEERAPAPAQRLFWTLPKAKQEAARLNSGLDVLGSRDRFRVVRLP